MPTIALRKHRYPSLYQVNMRVSLQELAVRFGQRVTLDDIPVGKLASASARGL